MDPKIWQSDDTDPNISLPLDDRTSNPIARSKRKQVVSTDDDKDEDLNDAVDKVCKAIVDYISPEFYGDYKVKAYKDLYRINKSRLDPQGSWSSCSRFLAFSEEYKLKFKKFMERYSRVGIYPIEDVLPDYRPKAYPIAMLDDEDVLKRYKNFKRFDTVVDLSDHLFSTKEMVDPWQPWAERIREEWRILEEKLPETIFVRVYESRIDLLRAVIIGAKGTPYHDGLFFFDVYFPPMFPYQAPIMRYHSGGFGINPHLFECGEVCLNLIKTLTLASERLWPSYYSTVLELLVSIQDKVLNADPLFLQPGFIDSGPSVVAEYFSLLYNEDILIKSLKTMIYIMNKPPKNFEAFVIGHFRDRALDILKACQAYLDGLQVGCVVVGVGNQERCCSIEFRNDVASCMARLVYYLNKIGSSEANNFGPLSAPIPSVLGSSIIYKPELPRSSASKSAGSTMKCSEIEQAHLDSQKNSSNINEPLRSNEGVGQALVQVPIGGYLKKNFSAVKNIFINKRPRCSS